MKIGVFGKTSWLSVWIVLLWMRSVKFVDCKVFFKMITFIVECCKISSIGTTTFQVIRAYHRILDLKGKYVDLEVLEILGKAIIENLPDCDGVPCGALLEKCLQHTLSTLHTF